MAQCKSCKAEITWGTTTTGKPAPFNADGANHFATCPQRREWRKTAPVQESFSDLAAPKDEKREYPS